MIQQRQESHYRSILKGITWRIIATTDTILIVLLVTCLNGNCTLEDAIKIGFFEFLIKLFIYYFHERVWQNVLIGREVSTRLTLYKTISWRVLATMATFLISGTVLGVFNELAFYIAFLEVGSKLILYYYHERLWLRIPLGKIRRYFQRNKK